MNNTHCNFTQGIEQTSCTVSSFFLLFQKQQIVTWLQILPVFSSLSRLTTFVIFLVVNIPSGFFFVASSRFSFYASASSHSFQSTTHFSIVLLYYHCYWVFPCDVIVVELDFSLPFFFFFSSILVGFGSLTENSNSLLSASHISSSLPSSIFFS